MAGRKGKVPSAKARDRISKGVADRMSYNLPGVGEGLVDPDFDNLRDGELDGIVEGVGAHRGSTEDYN